MPRFLLCLLAVTACGPGRTTFATYPGAPTAFDRAGSDPKAVEIADKVFAAGGGPGNWEKTKQIRWSQTTTSDGKVVADGEQAWDRWNGRHYGRLKGEGQDIVVAYELYGDRSIGFAQEGEKKQNFDEGTRKRYVGQARDIFNVSTIVLALHLMVFEPGAKLTYVGPAKDDAGNEKFDELKITFEEPLRKSLEYRMIVDRETSLPHRIEIYKAGTNEKIGFTLQDWTTINGMKFARARGNMGYSGEAIAIKDIKIGDPDDDLFIAPITH
jgi:hypothetical protein